MASNPQARYRAFLHGEFKQLGLGRYRSRERLDLYQRTIDEIVHAMFPRVHEGVASTYGAMLLTDHPNSLRDCHGAGQHAFVTDGNPLVRHMADGIRSFFVTGGGVAGIVSFAVAATTELDLFTLRDSFLFDSDRAPYPFESNRNEMFIVQRYFDGTVTALLPEGIVIGSGNVWTFRPYQYAVLRYLGARVCLTNEQALPLRSTLRMCVHTIGPVPGLGATFVLMTVEDEASLLGAESSPTSPELLSLQNGFVFPWRDPINSSIYLHNPIAHLVTQNDGATLIDHLGRVRYVRAWLTPPSASLQDGPSGGGTRHLTAQAFSANIHGFVVVNSADGPTTVYHQGEAVVRTKDLTPSNVKRPPRQL